MFGIDISGWTAGQGPLTARDNGWEISAGATPHSTTTTGYREPSSSLHRYDRPTQICLANKNNQRLLQILKYKIAPPALLVRRTGIALL